MCVDFSIFSFGITPTMEKMYHIGVMRTKVDDCQFACITQTDYYRILHQGEENTLRHTEGDRTVLVTEQRSVEGGNRRGQVIIRVSSLEATKKKRGRKRLKSPSNSYIHLKQEIKLLKV
jgi:hypothetical protein